MRGVRVQRTTLRCTRLHGFRAAAIIYPNFYPKRHRGGIEMSYLMVIAANWSGRSGCVTSLPSWSCGFDSRRPLQFIKDFRFGVPTCPRLESSTGPQACLCDVSPAQSQSSNIVMLT